MDIYALRKNWRIQKDSLARKDRTNWGNFCQFYVKKKAKPREFVFCWEEWGRGEARKDCDSNCFWISSRLSTLASTFATLLDCQKIRTPEQPTRGNIRILFDTYTGWNGFRGGKATFLEGASLIGSHSSCLEILRNSASSFHWLSSSIFNVCSLSRIRYTSSHLHYMMFQTIQTIYFLWGYDPDNMSVSTYPLYSLLSWAQFTVV